MKKIFKIFCGFILIIAGLGYIFIGGISILAGLILIIAGLICLPKTLEFIESKIRYTLDSKTKYLIVIGCWILSIIIVPKDNLKSNSNTNLTQATSDTSIQTNNFNELSNDDKELKETIERELKSSAWEKGFDIDKNTTQDGLQISYVVMSLWAKYIENGENSSNKEINKLAAELKPKVAKIQKSEFPKFRKAYGSIIGGKLWVENIDIVIGGDKNKTITLIGGMFANRKNIEESQKLMTDALTMYRFNRVQYKWYKGDNDYTFYDMDVPSDDEPVLIEKNE